MSFLESDKTVSILMLWKRLHRQDLLLMPNHALRRSINVLWSMILNAADKFRKTAAVASLLDIARWNS